MNLLVITCFIIFIAAASGCADISLPTQLPDPSISASRLTSAGSLSTEAFLYKAYPKDVLVQYNDKDAHSKAKASTKAKGLPSWDESVLAQYKADILATRERIFAPQLSKGLKIISASSVVPQATLRVLNKEALEWLNFNPEITHIWLDASRPIQPVGNAIAR